MPSPNSLYEQFAGTTFPIDPAIITDGLTPLAPARSILMALFKAAINAEFATVWTSATSRITAGHPLIGTSPVQDTLELEPSNAVMTQRKAAFPLLCLHRTGTGTMDQHTLEIERLVQPWDLHYVLGPLDVGELRKIGDICLAVAKLVKLVIRRRGHPAYQNGALQFGGLGPSAIGQIDLKSIDGPGQAVFAGDPNGTIYYSLTMHLETVQYSYDVDGAFGDFGGELIRVNSGDDNGEIMPDLIIADTAAAFQYP